MLGSTEVAVDSPAVVVFLDKVVVVLTAVVVV